MRRTARSILRRLFPSSACVPLHSDQAQLIAHQYHLAEQRRDPFGGICDKARQRAVIGVLIPGYRHEHDVLPAQAFDPSTTGDALGVRQDNDFQEYARVVGRTSAIVVVVVLIEHRKV